MVECLAPSVSALLVQLLPWLSFEAEPVPSEDLSPVPFAPVVGFWQQHPTFAEFVGEHLPEFAPTVKNMPAYKASLVSDALLPPGFYAVCRSALFRSGAKKWSEVAQIPFGPSFQAPALTDKRFYFQFV